MNYLDAKAKCESERVTRKNVKKYFQILERGTKMSENFWEGEEQNVRNDLAQVKKRQKYFWNSNDQIIQHYEIDDISVLKSIF